MGDGDDDLRWGDEAENGEGISIFVIKGIPFDKIQGYRYGRSGFRAEIGLKS